MASTVSLVILVVLILYQGSECTNLHDPENGYRLNTYSYVGEKVMFECYKGYTLKGSNVLECMADREWSPKSPPTCEPPTCPDYPPFYNGEIYYPDGKGDHQIAHAVEVGCNTDSTLFPVGFDGVTYCDISGKWEVTGFTCESKARLGPKANMKLYKLVKSARRSRERIYSANEFESRTKFLAECEHGYKMYDEVTREFSNTTSLMIEVNNGTIHPPLQICKEGFDLLGLLEVPTCPNFPPFYNGKLYYIDNEGDQLISHIVEVNVRCNMDSTLFPDGFDGLTYCDSRGKWEHTGFTCERKARLGPKANMKLYKLVKSGRSVRERIYSAKEFESRTKCLAECEDRYEMYDEVTKHFSDKTSLNIEVNNGTIHPPLQICIEARCSLSGNIRNYFSYTGNGGIELGRRVEHDTDVTKTCKSDHEFEPIRARKLLSYRLTCKKGDIGTFPACIPKRCEIPHGKQAKIGITRYSSGDLVNSGETINVSCQRTEKLFFDENNQFRETPFSSTCTFGVWNLPTFPVCTTERCVIPKYDGTRYTANGKLVATAIKVDDGTKLTKLCDMGYEMPDDEDIVCDSGMLIGDTSCNPKSCHLPIIENSRNNADERVLSHNQQLTLICKRNYKLLRDGNELPSGRIVTICILGHLTRSFEGLECVPKACREVQNAYTYKTEVNRQQEDEISNTFDHNQYASIECKEHFSLVREGRRTETRMTTQCSFGKCTLDIPKGLLVDGRKRTKRFEIDSGTMVKLTCPAEYSLYNKAGNVTYAEYNVLCIGVTLSAPLPICVEAFTVQSQCNAPHGISNAEPVAVIDADATFEEGHNLDYKCNAGFIAAPRSKRICSKGQWTSFRCIRIECPSLQHPENGKRLNNDSFVANRAMFECNEGYTLKGSNSLVCRADRKWRPKSPPTCEQSCHLPIIENSWKNAEKKVLFNNQQWKLICKRNHTLWKDGNELHRRKIVTTCILGNLTKSIDGLECVPKGCHAVQNADLYKIEVNGQQEDEISTAFDHKQYASIECMEHFSLVKIGSMLSETRMTTQCSFGSWDPKYYCKRDKPDNPESVTANSTTEASTMASETTPSQKDTSQQMTHQANDELEDKPDNPESVTANSTTEASTMASETTPSQKDTSQQMTHQANDEFEDKPDNPESVTANSTTEASTMASETTPSQKDTSQQMTHQANDEFEGNLDNPESVKPHSTTDTLSETTPPQYHTSQQTTHQANEAMCQKTCSENGGTCVAPNKCKCDQPRYGINCEKVGCTLPDVPKTVVVINETMTETFFEIGATLSRDAMSCPPSYYIPTDSILVCQENNSWSEKPHCVKGSVYIVTIVVGDYTWHGTWNNVEVSLSNQNGDTITNVLFQGPLYPGTVHKSTIKAKYIGQIEKSSIAIQVIKSTDDIVITKMHVVVENANDDEEYIFSNVGVVVSQLDKWPDTGCPPPTFTIKPQKRKQRYIAGDNLRDRDVICPEGLSLYSESITCQNTGQWSGTVSCAKVARYRVTLELGNGFFAGSSDDLYLTFFGTLGQTDSKMLKTERRDRNELYTYDVYAIDVGQILKMNIRRIGLNYVYLKYIRLDVIIGNAEDRYMFSDVGWVNNNRDISPDPGCLAPTGEVQLRTQNGKYLTYEEIQMKEIQCQNGVPRTAMTCLKDGRWSGTPCEAAGTINYRIVIKVSEGTKDKVEVTLKGKDVSSDKLAFADQGLSKGRTAKRSFTLPNIGEVTRIRLTLSDKWNDPMEISYIHLTAQETNDTYFFFHSGQISGYTELFAQKLFKPGCAGESFTNGHRGWSRTGIREGKSDLKSCQELCIKDNDCKAIEKRLSHDRFRNLYYVVKTNDLGQFVFSDNPDGGEFFFRKC